MRHLNLGSIGNLVDVLGGARTVLAAFSTRAQGATRTAMGKTSEVLIAEFNEKPYPERVEILVAAIRMARALEPLEAEKIEDA